jgi:hypothetical protein
VAGWFKKDVTGTVNDNTIIVGDINGDKIADFQIEPAAIPYFVRSVERPA